MSASYEFDALDHFTIGTIGPKGERVFMIQARRGDGVVTLRLEKQQVAALAERLDQLVTSLSTVEVPDRASAGELVDPEPAWVVGALAVGVEAADRIVVLAEELVVVEDDELEPPDGSTASFRLDPAQVLAFVDRAREVVAAGRPPCPFCGLPVDRIGDFCPCWN